MHDASDERQRRAAATARPSAWPGRHEPLAARLARRQARAALVLARLAVVRRLLHVAGGQRLPARPRLRRAQRAARPRPCIATPPSSAALELVRMAVIHYAAITWTKSWVHMQTFLRANLLKAQMASGGPEAGQPVGSAGEALTHFRDDVEDVTWLIDGVVDVSGRPRVQRRRRNHPRHGRRPCRGGAAAADDRRRARDPLRRQPDQGLPRGRSHRHRPRHRARRRHDGGGDDGQGQRRRRAPPRPPRPPRQAPRRDRRARPRPERGRVRLQPRRRRRRLRPRPDHQRLGDRRTAASASARWRCSPPTSDG